MEKKIEITELTTPEQVDDFIHKHKKVIIFKSGTCWITERAWDILQKSISAYADIPVGYVTVVNHRKASSYISEISRTRHQSPQILIIQGRSVLFERNNMFINEDDLQKAIKANFRFL